MLRYQISKRRVSWDTHYGRKVELWEEQGGRCAICGRVCASPDEGVRHHPIMVSQGGIDIPGLGNEQFICHECHKKIHPWLKRVI